jgi:hypothetical protein
LPTPSDGDETLPELGFDPEAVLERDSRILLDPSFLATLHRELADEMKPEDAALTLVQMGFLHGLQDAIRVLSEPARSSGTSVFAPPLQMPCRPVLGETEASALRIAGGWPERREAEAHLSALGPADSVRCHLSAGYTSGWLTGTFDADLLAVETSCSAAGAHECAFLAREASRWRADDDDEGVRRQLAQLPFGHFRALVRERVARGNARRGDPELGGVDRRAAAVHVWGPVMVIPWSGPETTLQTFELLARDVGAAEVSVIVLDLHGAMIDEAYGALTLEKLVETSDSWGTEVLLVDPSPLCEAVLADLDPKPLLTMKDLEPAVALAFQIARSQRRAV